MGGRVAIGQDCWIAGNVIILPGVTVGDGCTIGAGSVVTKVGSSKCIMRRTWLKMLNQDVPPCHVAAGNPARILRKIERSGTKTDGTNGSHRGPIKTTVRVNGGSVK